MHSEGNGAQRCDMDRTAGRCVLYERELTCASACEQPANACSFEQASQRLLFRASGPTNTSRLEQATQSVDIDQHDAAVVEHHQLAAL